MQGRSPSTRRLGVAIVGLGGAVATTAVAGVALLRQGLIGTEGLPLAGLPAELVGGLVAYEQIVFGGWDLCGDTVWQAAITHNVLPAAQLLPIQATLEALQPWQAVGNAQFCRNVGGEHRIIAPDHRGMVEIIHGQLQHFRHGQGLDNIVVINLASTERSNASSLPIYRTIEAFEQALDDNHPDIGPAMLYAYAAITAGAPYINFTPSLGADVPALVALAEQNGVPVGGKDGKTGQTMMKTVIAPALRSRALRVDGWFSTNILGNRDGEALADQASLQSKLNTKASVLDQILGYHVESHLVDIRYYKPRGDNKEAWDNIDVTGFLGQPMQIKINFLCRDSILAAPLVIELARLQDWAQQQGSGGVQEHVGAFFKLPQTADPALQPEHALHVQEQRLYQWLAMTHAEAETDDSLVHGHGA